MSRNLRKFMLFRVFFSSWSWKTWKSAIRSSNFEGSAFFSQLRFSSSRIHKNIKNYWGLAQNFTQNCPKWPQNHPKWLENIPKWSPLATFGTLRGLRGRSWSLRGLFWEPPGSILEHFRANLRSISGWFWQKSEKMLQNYKNSDNCANLMQL